MRHTSLSLAALALGLVLTFELRAQQTYDRGDNWLSGRRPAISAVPATTSQTNYLDPNYFDSSAPDVSSYQATYEGCECLGPWLGCSNCPPAGYVQADGLYWHRVGTGCDQILATDTNRPQGLDTVLRTSDLHFNGTGGFRVLVGWRPACCSPCSAWELSYFGIFGWNANQSVSGPGTLAMPGDLGVASNNFFMTDILAVNYQSQLHNVELNCVKTCCKCCAVIDFLCGFRYINLNETFTITGTDFEEGRSNYNVHTDNNLSGLQLGGRYTRGLSNCWSVQLTGKSGIFLNAVHETQAATDYPTAAAAFSLRDRVSKSGCAVASLAELNLVLVRHLNDTWMVRFGYTAIGLGGLALAPDQLDFTNTVQSGSNLHSTGWIFVHGGLVGVQATW